MTISDRIHIVEKRKIAENTETKSGRVGQRSPDQRRDAAVDPEPADVRIGKHGLRYFEEIPRSQRIQNAEMQHGVLRKKRRHFIRRPNIRKGQILRNSVVNFLIKRPTVFQIFIGMPIGYTGIMPEKILLGHFEYITQFMKGIADLAVLADAPYSPSRRIVRRGYLSDMNQQIDAVGFGCKHLLILHQRIKNPVSPFVITRMIAENDGIVRLAESIDRLGLLRSPFRMGTDENGNFTFRKFRKPVSCTNPVDHADGRQFLHRIIPAVSGRQIDMRRTAAAMLEGQDRLIGIYFATPRFFLVPYGRKRNAYMNDIVERSAAIDYLRYMMSDPAFVLRRRDRQYGQLPVKGFGQPRKVISRSCSARTAQDDRLTGLCRQTARHIGRRTLIDRRIDLEIGILLYRSDERYVRSARRYYDFTDVISFQQSDHDLRIAFGCVILFHDICLTIIEKRINYRLISFRMSSNKLRGIYLAARYAKRNFTDGISRSGVRSPVILSQRASAVQTICANRGFRTKRSRQNRNPSAGFVKPAVSQNRSICVLSNLRSYHLSYRT